MEADPGNPPPTSTGAAPAALVILTPVPFTFGTAELVISVSFKEKELEYVLGIALVSIIAVVKLAKAKEAVPHAMLD